MVWESIEGGRGGDAVSARIFKHQPVTALQFRQHDGVYDDVVGIASPTPNNASLQRLSRIFFQRFDLHFDAVRRVHIEALVDAVSDVVVNDFLAIRVDFDVLRVNVGSKRESLFSEISSGLRDDSDFAVWEKFLQTFIYYFRDARLE